MLSFLAQSFMIQTAIAELEVPEKFSVTEDMVNCKLDSDDFKKYQAHNECTSKCEWALLTEAKCSKKKEILECLDKDCSKCEGILACQKDHDKFVKNVKKIKEDYKTACPKDKDTEYGLCHAAPMARVGLLLALLALW